MGKKLTQNTFDEKLLTKDTGLQAEILCRGPPYDWNFYGFKEYGGEKMDDIPNKIWVDGKSYEVTKEVYEVYIKYGRKMRYFEYDLSATRSCC